MLEKVSNLQAQTILYKSVLEMPTTCPDHSVHIYFRHTNCLPRPFCTYLLQTCKLSVQVILNILVLDMQTACPGHSVHICFRHANCRPRQFCSHLLQTCKLPALTMLYISRCKLLAQYLMYTSVQSMQTACQDHFICRCFRHANYLPRPFCAYLLQT